MAMDRQKSFTGKKKPKPSPQPKQTPITTPPPATPYLPDLPNYDPEPADGVRVGESPVPGLTLRHILRGHKGTINRIAWSPDGRFLASPSNDKTIRIWDVAHGKCIAVLKGHKGQVSSVAWSPDGHRLASGSFDKTIRIWDAEIWKTLQILQGYEEHILSVAWSPTENILASAMSDYTIQLFETTTWRSLRILGEDFQGSDVTVSIAFSPDGKQILSAATQSSIGSHVWDIESGRLIIQLRTHDHESYDYDLDVAWSPTGRRLALASDNNSINIFCTHNWRLEHVLEGHTNSIRGLCFSGDGRLIASRSVDGNIRIWLGEKWKPIAILKMFSNAWYGNLSFDPSSSNLAVTGDKDNAAILIFGLDLNTLTNSEMAPKSINYTTAKLVLVGDSGVGKTGLGWRLAHGKFKEHASTHGQQFWVIAELSTKRKNGTECEAVLWDLAGQHIYRPIHSIFLDNVDASLVLFDPSNRQDPLKGAQFWLEQLKGKGQLPPSVLIGARIDRGAPAVSQEYLAQFCQRYGISGGYISTSAKSGEGLAELTRLLQAQIPWDKMTTTVTTVTFKRIKDYVLTLKEKPDRKGVLVRPTELREQLQANDMDWQFTDAEMMTAVGHLQTHGYVTILKNSSGETYILLTPDLLVDLASSIVLLADKHPRELGAVSEMELLQGRYSFDELEGLDEAELHILLDAAVLRFLEHNVCFRETFGNDTLLIFPGLIKQKRPLEDDFKAADDMSYVVRGRVENLYAMLVVLLGYTPTFNRINQWQNQAQYEMVRMKFAVFV